VERSLAEISRRGKGVPGTGRRVIERRDLLADVDAVLGDDRVKLRDLVGLLRDHAPMWQPYKKMTATALRDALQADGVKVVNLSGTVYADPADVRRAVAERDQANAA